MSSLKGLNPGVRSLVPIHLEATVTEGSLMHIISERKKERKGGRQRERKGGKEREKEEKREGGFEGKNEG